MWLLFLNANKRSPAPSHPFVQHHLCHTGNTNSFDTPKQTLYYGSHAPPIHRSTSPPSNSLTVRHYYHDRVAPLPSWPPHRSTYRPTLRSRSRMSTQSSSSMASTLVCCRAPPFAGLGLVAITGYQANIPSQPLPMARCLRSVQSLVAKRRTVSFCNANAHPRTSRLMWQ
jgi:hypothetical protein